MSFLQAEWPLVLKVYDNDIAGIGFEECAIELINKKVSGQNTDRVVQMSNSTSLNGARGLFEFGRIQCVL